MDGLFSGSTRTRPSSVVALITFAHEYNPRGFARFQTLIVLGALRRQAASWNFAVSVSADPPAFLHQRWSPILTVVFVS